MPKEMTEKEILDRLKIGDHLLEVYKELIQPVADARDHLLEVYKELIQPVADALAELKSKAVYGKKGCYSGDLGCWEAGINTICLHIKDHARGKRFSRDRDEKRWEKIFRFERPWIRQLQKAGVKHLHIDGHY
jgi:hypothetical protein